MAQMVVTAGIDVSKEWLNIALWPLKAELQVDRTDVGYDQLATWLTKHGVMRVGLEVSGGYEIAVIDALEARGFCGRTVQCPAGPPVRQGKGPVGQERSRRCAHHCASHRRVA